MVRGLPRCRMLILVLIGLLLMCVQVSLGERPPVDRSRSYGRRYGNPPASRFCRQQRKPDWVRQELVRLHAWSPHLGCRALALTFNRRYAQAGMTVGKTYVANILRQRAWEAAQLRQQGKRHIPRPLPRNRIWALDLTGVTDLTGKQHLVLGVLDHGSRACLALTMLSDKRAITVLRTLLGLFRRYGLPRQLRVDNERSLNAGVIRASLKLLGVSLCPSMLHCPWQNGRIERFFGHLKREFRRSVVPDGADLGVKLLEFRAWYNHARPHQHLGGRTPVEVWQGRRDQTDRLQWLSVWNGQLGGWCAPPR